MKKITKLRFCDWSLLIFMAAMFLSSIQLEISHSRITEYVWIHIGLGGIFMGLAAYHIYLHFGKSDWLSKFHKQKNNVTRILWWLYILTLLTGIIAFIHWIGTYTHSPIGGIHGKFGLLMIILSIGHLIKRIKFFKPLSKTVS